MEKDKPSKTSEVAAVHRAVHQLIDDEPKILLDPIALRMEMPKDTDLNVERWPRYVRLPATFVGSIDSDLRGRSSGHST